MDSSLKTDVMIKYFYFCLCCLLFVSCFSEKQEKQETTEYGEVLSYDNASPLKQKYSDIFSRVETVPLDTIDNFLISDIRQFRYVLNRFFVLIGDLHILKKEMKYCSFIHCQIIYGRFLLWIQSE